MKLKVLRNHLVSIQVCISVLGLHGSLPASAETEPATDSSIGVTRAATSLPLLKLSDLRYQGGFRLPAGTYGASSMNYSQGPIVYDRYNNSIFVVGHTDAQAVAEFSVPPLVHSTKISDLMIAPKPVQSFVRMLTNASAGNPQRLDTIAGLALVGPANDRQLLVNAFEYYDAPADNTQTTLVVRSPGSLSNSAADGFFTFSGGAGHTSGWMSRIPQIWRPLLGGTHLTGQSSGQPIITRFSVGPSAFAFTPDAFSQSAPRQVSTQRLLDYSMSSPLHADLFNDSRHNDVWTHLSRVVYGLIVPGTRTYMTIGYSGGHESGVCYKCNSCGGYCARSSSDYQHYYWLFDVADLLEVKQGSRSPSSVRPYDWGEFPTPFRTREIGGGSYDQTTGLLYLTVQRADTQQGAYTNPPVVVAYSFAVNSDPNHLFSDSFETGRTLFWTRTN